MIKTVLSWIIPALLLAYYWKAIRSGGQDSRWALGLLGGGTACFYLGLLLSGLAPTSGSTLRLFGACLFFSGVALHTVKHQASPAEDASREQEDDSPSAEG